MEDPLKARLIGASILVVLAVALVPELLSGPKHSPANGAPKATRTVTIDLGGAVARVEPRPDTTQPASRTPVLPNVGSAAPEPAPQPTSAPDESVPTEETPPPEPNVVTPPAAKPAAKPAAQPVPAQVAETRPSVPESDVAPAPQARGGYSVQVGAFGTDASARKLVNDLKSDGYSAYIAPLSKGGKTLHRVRVGPAADKAAADNLAVKLKSRGLPVAVVSGG
jgi:DedD protein